MKGGGGLTWLGWGMLGIGGMLIYAGMTGQSLAGEIAAVLNGRSPKAPASAPASSSGAPVGSGLGSIADHAGKVADAAGGTFGIPLPNPTYGPLP